MWVYESHLGGIYADEEQVPYKDLYCEECGDSDWELGRFDTAEEFLISMVNEIDYPLGYGGYGLDYMVEFANETFGSNVTRVQLIKIIEQYRKDEEDEEDE